MLYMRGTNSRLSVKLIQKEEIIDRFLHLTYAGFVRKLFILRLGEI